MSEQSSNRREFFDSLRPPNENSAVAATVPAGGSTVHVATQAMACEFAVVMNPGPHERVTAVGEVLDLIAEIEGWLSTYKVNSEVSTLNRQASLDAVHVRRPLFDLLMQSKQLSEKTDGAFDITSGAMIQMWRSCRHEQRLPSDDEVADALARSGSRHLLLDEDTTSVRFSVDGLTIDPGAIGKGFALDEAALWLKKLEQGPDDFIVHGGHSSLIARGRHNGQGGWPVGIGNPLFTQKRLGTVLLKDSAMSTSGSNIQFFRHEGRRYGHILDPRTATPVEGMLSVTVFAESAAVADALSTAFFVLGVENAQKCCDNLKDIGAILVPFPEKGSKVRPTIINVPEDQVFWDNQQVDLS